VAWQFAVSDLAAGAVLAFMYVARDFLLPTVVAALVATTIYAVVSVTVRLRAPRSLAALIGTLIAVAVVALIVFVLLRC